MNGLPLRTPWRGAVFLVVCFFTPLLAYLGPLGFATLIPLAGLVLVPYWLRRRPDFPDVLIVGALVLWAVASLGWSPARPAGFASYDQLEQLTALKLVLQLGLYGAFAAALARLSPAAAARGLAVLGYGLVAMSLILALESMSGAALYQTLKQTFEDPIRPDLAVRNVAQATIVLALLAWPVMLYFRSLRPWAIYPIGFAVFGAAYLLEQLAPAAAFVAGGAAAGLVAFAGRSGARVVAVLLALQVMATPWLVSAGARSGLFDTLQPLLPKSWEARLEIWTYAAARVHEHPWLGWGLDASRLIGGPVSLHTHNGALQVWLELGAVGAALFALIWVVVFETIARTAPADRTGAAACAGAAGAYFTVGSLSFGVWQEWWLALAALTAAVCFALLRVRARERLAGPPPALRPGELAPL